jgi:hypothetical protein
MLFEERVALRVFLRALPLVFMVCPAAVGICGSAPQANDGVTQVRVTNQVVLRGVTRLGMNLGEENFYDSGQMLKNLIARNPEFAPLHYRSIFHCQAGGAARCVDTRGGIQFAENFWAGARYEVLDGAAAGQRGTVAASGAGSGGYVLTLGSGRPIGAGDWIAVEKEIVGDPAPGWWPTVSGGAQLSSEGSDLPPGLAAKQALRMEAAGAGESAQVNAYFDSTPGKTFVHLRGRYRLRFRAKAAAGSNLLHVHVARLAPEVRRYVDAELRLKPEWAVYEEEFTANETALPAAAVEVSFRVSGGTVLLADADLEKIDGDATNRTIFRDEVVATLKELRPGVLRLMESEAGLGSTMENLLAQPAARERSGYRAWQKKSEDIPIGIPEFLELCREVSADPWIVAPSAMSLDEARELAEYLAGAETTRGGALRAAQGRRAPWTKNFGTIHIELGNETWNRDFAGESMEDPAAYGGRANAVFAAFRAAAPAARFDLVVGTHVFDPGRNVALLAAAPQANTLAIAPYLMRSLTQWGSDDELYGPLLAEPEQMSRDGFVAETAVAAGGRQLAVYEVNLHTTGGTAPGAVLDRLTPSAAAGVSVAGHMLRMMRDHGVRDEMIYSLPQFEFRRADGTPVRLWGSVVEMGGRARPQLLAASLANRVIRGDMVKVEIAGADPVHDQPAGNDQVELRGAHEIDAYAFADGKWHGLIVFNYGLHTARRVEIEAPGPISGARLWRLVSAGPGATNEEEEEVKIQEDHFTGRALTLAPCSMAVLEWNDER